MKFQPAFERMRQIVEAEDCLLSGYEMDFYQYDLQHLSNTGTVGGRYVWVIRANGTHLASLGLHPKLTEFVECALNMKEALQVFEITLLESGDAAIKPITVAKARELISVQQYEFNGRHIKHRGRLIALVDVEPVYYKGQYGGTVSYTFDAQPTSDVEASFKQIALCLFQQKVHSLFACMDGVTFRTQSLS